LYDGEIAYADSALARFVAYLKASGKYRNALIVVVGDHGEGLGEHHEDTHGIFLYDSTTHVPLIVKLPRGENRGTLVAAQVRTVDIVPTLVGFTGAAANAKSDGESLQAYSSGKNESERPVVGETDYPLRFGWAPLRSLRNDGYKFIEAPRPELYDLRHDAAESTNQYEAGDVRVEKSRAMLAEVRNREALAGRAKADVNMDISSLPDPKDKIEEQNLLHAAMMASEDNRSLDARKALEQVLALDPNSPTASRQLGELELRMGNYAQAAQHLKKAVAVRPDDAMASFYEGQALEKVRDPAGARDALEASLKLLPGQFPARLLLGKVYLDLNDANPAEDQFEAALLLQSDSLEAQLGLAKAQILKGNLADAVQSLEALSKKHPKDADVFNSLATASSGLGKKAEAQLAQAKAKSLSSPK